MWVKFEIGQNYLEIFCAVWERDVFGVLVNVFPLDGQVAKGGVCRQVGFEHLCGQRQVRLHPLFSGDDEISLQGVGENTP